MAIVIAYARVPQGAARHGVVGLDEQCLALLEWAKRRRHRILSMVTEDVPSGPLDERKGLADVMLGLKVDHVTGLVVHQLACLDEDLVTQEQLRAEVQSLRARLFSVDPRERDQLLRTPADPYRRTVRQILSRAAANEQALAALRASSTRAAAGAPPYGYRSEDGDFVPEPSEQETLSRIAELRAKGATLREIAQTLEKEGRQPRRSDRWHPESLRRIAERLET